MALTVHPTDGFINRLLLQSSRPAAPTTPLSSSSAGQDQMSISPEARQSSVDASQNRQLESRLLQMYNNKGSSA